MRILLAIGCNSYHYLTRLAGAELDARRVWRALTADSPGQYEPQHSSLLLSPTLEDVRGVLRGVPTDDPVDAFTLYFAGHGGVRSGSYYFCTADTQPSRLSTTGMALSELLGADAREARRSGLPCVTKKLRPPRGLPARSSRPSLPTTSRRFRPGVSRTQHRCTCRCEIAIASTRRCNSPKHQDNALASPCRNLKKPWNRRPL